ncbi:MAG TPA: ParB/RepB/Spo0J family partition protein [Candidatus Omnitrophica bacterium]|nr:ParB/RepB/Spo0J family partition protein [Candidatus Omnitrophota bacterium]
MEKKALGRGLSALIPEKPIKQDHVIVGGITNLRIEEIVPNPYQPRKEFDPQALQDLTASIKEKGLIQPVIVRKREAGGYELIAGERRLRAAKLLQHKEIQVIIKEVNDEESLELSLIENIQREELNPLEQARAYQELIDKFKFTQGKIAQAMGKARTTINNTLRILRLPEKIQGYISSNLLSFSHARALLEIEDASEQTVLADRIIASELSVRQLEGLLKQKTPLRHKKKKTAALNQPPHISALEEQLQHMFGTKVKIVQRKKRGRIEIEFYSQEDLKRILEVLKDKL